MVKQLAILLFCPLLSIGQDSTYLWGSNPTSDRVYYQSVMLQNARFDFYENLRLWVEKNGTKELRTKAKLTEKNFILRIKNETLTPEQIKAIMAGMVTVYRANMYGHDLAKQPEHELGKLNEDN